MADQKQNLSNSELAALDLLIARMQENGAPKFLNLCVGLIGAVSAAAAVVSAAAAVVTAVTAVTSSAAASDNQLKALTDFLDEKTVPVNLSLDDLVKLRSQLN
jgi:hypothetical protein